MRGHRSRVHTHTREPHSNHSSETLRCLRIIKFASSTLKVGFRGTRVKGSSYGRFESRLKVGPRAAEPCIETLPRIGQKLSNVRGQKEVRLHLPMEASSGRLMIAFWRKSERLNSRQGNFAHYEESSAQGAGAASHRFPSRSFVFVVSPFELGAVEINLDEKLYIFIL